MNMKCKDLHSLRFPCRTLDLAVVFLLKNSFLKLDVSILQKNKWKLYQGLGLKCFADLTNFVTSTQNILNTFNFLEH